MPMNLTIDRFMTRDPHTIGVGQTLATAHRIMREHKIRHLPVLENGKLVGIVTQRDLALVETLRDVDPDLVTIEEAMTGEPCVVGPHAKLAHVAREMASHKYGCVVVVERGFVVGIFTTVDALEVLLGMVEKRQEAQGAGRKEYTH
jgi:acetoin utilization protein AcuB